MADAGVHLLRVGITKYPPHGHKWVITDGGTNILPRALRGTRKFKIISANKASMNPTEKVNVAGPMCFGGDVIGWNVKLPAVVEGDLLAVLGTGAYTSSASNQYNMRPRPPIVLVSDGQHYLIKEAEQYEDLIRRDIVPR